MKINTIIEMIALRGAREQAFKFSFGWKGGMKQCYHKGCEIFVPLHYALKGIDISEAIKLDRMHEREIPVNVEY